MKLFLKRDNSGEDARFVVFDETGRQKYSVKGKRSVAADNMVITLPYGKPLVTLKVCTFHFFSVFSVKSGCERFVITLTGMPHNPEYRFHGLCWRVCRFSPDRNFTVIDIDNSLIMKQKTLRNYDDNYYELTIMNEERELICVATAICADVVNYLTLAAAAPV